MKKSAGPVTVVATGIMAIASAMLLGDSWNPLLRFLALVVVLGGTAVAIGWFLGPVVLGITSVTGVAGAAVGQLDIGQKRRRR